jgi:phosphatidylcholine synthase
VQGYVSIAVTDILRVATPVPKNQRPWPVVFAWAVHALTASGAVLALFALLQVEQEHWKSALLWLGAALVVDGIDGPLARLAGVTQRSPGISGVTLDLVVDYLTYVFVPAVLIYRANLLPASFALAAVALILVSSLYTFARTDMKTSDNFFLGFPALWNIVAYYLFVLQPGPLGSAAAIGLFSLLTFAPIHFVHPLRVRVYQPWLAGLTLIWGASSLALLTPNLSRLWGDVWLVLSLAGAGVLLTVGVLRTRFGPSSGR